MSHVFVSYAHVDYEFVQNIIERLREANINVWLDTDQLRIGEEWRTGIDTAIEDAFALIVVMSPAAKNSEYVTYEWAFALGAKKTVIPILYKDTELHPRLEVLQYLDFRDFLNRPWSRLVDYLSDTRVVSTAVSVKLPRGVPQSILQAASMLDSPNPDDRARALETITQMNHPLVNDTLAALVEHPIQDVSIHTAFALADRTDFEDKRAIPGLVLALARSDEAICIRGASALGKYGEPETIPKLFIRLFSRSGKIRRAVANALVRIGSPTTQGFIHELSKRDSTIRDISAWALGEIGDPEAVEGLVNCLSDRDAGVRRTASESLIRIGIPAVTPLIASLEHEHWNVRQQVARILGRIGDRQAIEALAQVARSDENGDVRKIAVEALGHLKDPATIPALQDALDDKY